jgi:Pyridoxamine 5'-phosphate oxidase
LLSPETIAFLESGCGVVVGTVGADGAPHVSRGWGITVTSTDPTEVRVLLDADDTVAADYLAATGAVAVTAGNVRTLQATQFKGRAAAVEQATADDRDRAARYADAFFGNINAVDGTPLELINTLRAPDYVACTIRVEEMYDQSPGPSAGTRLTEAAP